MNSKPDSPNAAGEHKAQAVPSNRQGLDQVLLVNFSKVVK